MEPYARALCASSTPRSSAARRVEAFALGTRLTRLTRELSLARSRRRPRRRGRAGASTGRAAPGSAKASAQFNDEWGVRGMARGAIVVILSDGWDRGDPRCWPSRWRGSRRVAYQVVWVNPLKASPGLRAAGPGMAAALPYVDEFVEGHSLAALEAAGRGDLAMKRTVRSWTTSTAGRPEGQRVAVARVVGRRGLGTRASRARRWR